MPFRVYCFTDLEVFLADYHSVYRSRTDGLNYNNNYYYYQVEVIPRSSALYKNSFSFHLHLHLD